MPLGELKPILTSLVVPPAGLLLLALFGLLVSARWRRAGLTLAVLGIVGTLLLASNAVAVALARNILPQVAAVTPAQLRHVQAIVVLGGGVLPEAMEYGTPQLTPGAAGRARYGAWLAKRSGKPLGFAGGIGWGGAAGQEPEGQVARRSFEQDFGLALRWVDDASRDTRENALRMAQAMHPQGVRRIALVTDAWHMPRAVLQFRAAGFEVLPAPTNFAVALGSPANEWLPSTHGLMLSRQVLREWLALRVASL